jgi:hypothetical protein
MAQPPAQAMIAAAPAAAVSVRVVSLGIWQEWLLNGLYIGAALIEVTARQSAARAALCYPG